MVQFLGFGRVTAAMPSPRPVIPAANPTTMAVVCSQDSPEAAAVAGAVGGTAAVVASMVFPSGTSTVLFAAVTRTEPRRAKTFSALPLRATSKAAGVLPLASMRTPRP